MVAGKSKARIFDTVTEPACKIMNAIGNRLQTFRTMPDSKSCCHIGKECLSSTNIRRCFVTTDMLFTRLQSKTVGNPPFGINRLSDNASGNHTCQGFGYRQITGMRTTKSHWHAETLHRAHNHIGSPKGRRFHDCQSQRVSDNNNQCTFGFGLFDDIAMIDKTSLCVGPWQNDCRCLIGNLAL